MRHCIPEGSTLVWEASASTEDNRMKKAITVSLPLAVFLTLGSLLQPDAAGAQMPGKSIGSITTQGDLIIMELDADAVALPNLFDLEGRTLRFTPEGTGYRAENLPLQWDPEIGAEIDDPQVGLEHFSFPMAGSSWDSIFVNPLGSISLGAGARAFPIGRFAELRTAGASMVNTVPIISAFLKPRMSGTRFLNQHPDRVVVTWDLSEPVGGIFDFTFESTVNRFQAVLHRDGPIDLSYREVSAEDAVVGVFTPSRGQAARSIATASDDADSELPGYLDVRAVRLAETDGLLTVTIETRDPLPAEDDPALDGLNFRVLFDLEEPFASGSGSEDADIVWSVRGRSGRGYTVSGTGVSGQVHIEGNTITLQGLPSAFRGAEQTAFYMEVQDPEDRETTVDEVAPTFAALAQVGGPEVDLSGVSRVMEPMPTLFEAFHYAGLPHTQSMACTVIEALGDQFDFLVYYSDFRVDNQEAGTPSTGAIGDKVTGFGQDRFLSPADYCSGGHLQDTFTQPVYIGSNQGQERAPDGSWWGYDYAMSQVGHELAHRWIAFASATVDGRTFPLGPTHWALGLHAPVAFPYKQEYEASTEGGAYWRDNGDGTYTLLADNFYSPAQGFSHLDLYFLGFLPPSEVPDMMFLENLERLDDDADGNRVYGGDPLTVTIEDVIAANGPRLPAFEDSQREFKTGMVAIVLNGAEPSRPLLENLQGIRDEWVHYWSKTTGGVASMRTDIEGPPQQAPGQGR